jgi:YtkA-like
MKCVHAAVLGGALLAGGAHAAAPCGSTLPGDKRLLENARYQVAYRTEPQTVPVGTHFVVDFAVCPRGKAAAPTAVRVDANMPDHRHGMNYRPQVTTIGPGVYRAEGLLFHMPGRWDLTFDIVAGNATQRLASTLRIE